ncbi:CHAT domain-containing protein [Zafaria sp. J156]|uniref:CHAT domain-containing protein n=1 Tax=Zafaria sp. J156 TaxID=3116490 RepID=UPI002E76D6BA|nr:CHAT domain-containing protein [Zafaria sp. J156]MEE1620957.1 CHAT domain-containing protein [Zafaria sp. J156]
MPSTDPLAAADEAYQAARAAIAQYRLPQARAHLDEARSRLRQSWPPAGAGPLTGSGRGPGGGVGRSAGGGRRGAGRDDEIGGAGDQALAARELGWRIRLTESWLTCDEEGLPAALAAIRAVSAEAAAAGSDGVRALAHIQSGVLLARAGDFDAALGQLRPAVGLSGSLPVDDRVRLLLNKGTIGSRTGSLAEAADDLREAARLSDALPAYRFMALHNLGFVEYLRGDLPAALRIMAEADGLDVEVDRSVARHDRARVLMEAGLVEDAAPLIEQAVGELRDAGLAAECGEARLDQARCAVLAGRPADAVRLAAAVVAESTERGEDARAQEAEAVRLEALLLGSGPVESMDPALLADQATALAAAARHAGRPWLADRAIALALIATGRAASGADGPGNPAGFTASAPEPPRALVAARHPGGAPASDSPALPADARARLRRMRASPYLSTRILAVLAQLATAQDPAARGRLLRAAARDTAAARAGVASLDLRTAVAVHLAPVMRIDLARAAAGGDAWAALRATERWRHALQGVPSVHPPGDARVAGLWSSLRRHHEEVRTAGPSEAGRLRAEAAGIEHRLREHYWSGRSEARAGPGPRLSRAAWGPASVLSYFWAGDALHVVAVEPGRPARLERLGDRPRITELVDRAVADAAAAAQAPAGPLAAVVLSSLGDSLARLEDAILPGPVAEGPIVVVPSGALARLPWGMLPGLRGRGVTLSRSVGAWDAGRTELGRPPRVAVAAGPGLALARHECARVAGHWPGALTIPAEPAAVTAALAAYDVVHLAAHGRHREDSPLFSSLRLHGGALFAHELEQVPIRASLVVLSACGAGRGRLRPGDEALGLTSSLLAMGVKAVVAPLTDVPDHVAARLMPELHSRLAAGQDGPSALAAAADGMLDGSFAWFGSGWRVG